MFLLIIRRNIGFGSSTVISIHLMFLLIEAKDAKLMSIDHFNTSHVSINHCGSFQVDDVSNFNTSHVSINLISSSTSVPSYEDFNTSHVSINPCTVCMEHCRTGISIHLMFLLITILSLLHATRWNFNTSHVSINLLGTTMRATPAAVFQYISCFY